MFFLGVDGGGTKTDFVLINEKGEVVAASKGPTCAYQQVGIDNFKIGLKRGIVELCSKAKIEIHNISFSCFGIPTYGEISEDTSILEDKVKEILKNDRFICVNDVEVGWAGSLACEPGINLVAGTGTIGFGMDQHGNTARSSGWGEFCGDEGSSFWLGRKLIGIFTKQADGRLQKSLLYDLVRKRLCIKRDLDLISFVHNKLQLKRDNIAKLQLLLHEAAVQGDLNAIKAYKEAAYELSLVVYAIKNLLNFEPNKAINVSYSGGVFKAGSFILEPFKEYISVDNVVLREPLLIPTLGAALLALKHYLGTVEKNVISNLKSYQGTMLL